MFVRFCCAFLFLDKMNDESANVRLYNECLQGNMNEVKQMLKNKDINVHYGFRGACFGGHKDIVLLLIANGANMWNTGLFCASQNGHEHIALLLIEKEQMIGIVVLWEHVKVLIKILHYG